MDDLARVCDDCFRAMPEVQAAENDRLRALIKQAEWSGSIDEEPCCPWCDQYRYGYDDDEPTKCPAFGLHKSEVVRPRPEPRTGPLFGLEKIVMEEHAASAMRVLGPLDTCLLSWWKK
jgi:hypothetical protein